MKFVQTSDLITGHLFGIIFPWYHMHSKALIGRYENLQSISAKAAYAKANRLGGLWFYDISADDFNGTFCGNGTFPLIRAAKNTFQNTSIPITTTARPTTTPLPTKVIRPFI
jgi:GH18 family chitinase